MAALTAPISPSASPSDADAAGLHNTVRHENVSIDLGGTLAAAVLEKRFYVPRAGRLMGVSSFRRTAGSGAGAGGSTDVDVNLNGSTVLAATKMEHENADGNGTRVVGTLLTSHAAYDGHGIAVVPGDYFEVQIDAIEAGATAPLGLFVQFDFLWG